MTQHLALVGSCVLGVTMLVSCGGHYPAAPERTPASTAEERRSAPEKLAPQSPPTSDADQTGRTIKVRQSERLRYSWTLPDRWAFAPSDALGPIPANSAVEVLIAKCETPSPAAIQLLVGDLVVVPPRRKWGTPEDYDNLETYGKQWLRDNNAQLSASRRLAFAGGDAVEVTGAHGDLEYSVRLFYRDRRRFEARCFAPPRRDVWPCDSAFSSFQVGTSPDDPTDGNTPRVLHLRDARFGIAFDAPDDSWLAVGPSTGGGGAQVVWIWRSNAGQIDVQAMDLSVAPSNHPDQSAIAQKTGESMSAKGASVKTKEYMLAGATGKHLVIDRSDGKHQDMFILVERNVYYAILVTQANRDERLVNKVAQGFRLTPK